MIRRIFNKFVKSQFAKDSITLVTGTTIAQILPILISPILTRIYSPEDIGVLQLFTSIVMIFAIIGNGRYELAIILPRKDSYAINVWALSVYVAFFTASVLLIVILLFHDFFVHALKNEQIGGWLYLAPLAVLAIAIFNSFNYLFTREKKYKTIAIVRVIRSSVVSLLQLGLYFVGSGALALLGGYTVGQAAGAGSFAFGISKRKKLLKKVNKPTMIAVAKRYKRFPQFTMVGSLFNRLNAELPTLFISSVFDAATLGFYGWGNRMLQIPSTFIGMSIGQVYMKQATEEVQRTGLAIKTFKSVLKRLFFIGLPIFATVYVSSEWLFGFIFGAEWTVAGQYARIVTPLLFVRFLVSPLSVTYSVFEEQVVSLFTQLGLLIVLFISFAIAWIMNLSFVYFLHIFVAIQVVYYLFFLFMLYQAAQGKLTKK